MRPGTSASSLSLLSLPLVLALVACGGDTPDTASQADEPADPAAAVADRRVEIVGPAEGDTVAGPGVTVSLAAHGFALVPAGDMSPNSGHHHLFLDRDLTGPELAIPTEEGFIVHMGDASSQFTFANVAPGPHRLIAVVGDAIHVPVQPLLVDTVNFVVR